MSKYQCPCCGYYTIEEIYDICDVCYWEYDPIQNDNPDYSGGANTVSLNDARKNYNSFGAKELRVKKYVRQPNKEEIGN